MCYVEKWSRQKHADEYLSGNLKPDEGNNILNRQEVQVQNQLHAQTLGIAMSTRKESSGNIKCS
jgi:hypothetical protein